VALLIGGEGLALDDARAARVKELTADLGTALTADRAAVRAALDDPKALKAALAEHAKPWKGTAAAAWFSEAELSVRAAAAYAALPADSTPTRLRGIAKELRAMADGMDTPEWRTRVAALALQAEGRTK